MAYRTCSKFHLIREQKRQNRNNNYYITLTNTAANKFDNVVMQEVILKDSILLIKSGCEVNDKVEHIAKLLM